MDTRDCPDCLGAGVLAAGGEPVLVFIGKTNARIRGLEEAVARAEALIARYCTEHTSDAAADGDHRVLSCREQVRAYELSIAHHRELLLGRSGEALAACIPCRGTGAVVVPESSPFPKTCGCGRVHETREAWQALPFCGLMADGEGGLLALRNCPCRSTLAVPATQDEASASRMAS